MNIFEAIKWLSPTEREQLIKNIEDQNLNGVEIVDYVSGHFNMACKRILAELYHITTSILGYGWFDIIHSPLIKKGDRYAYNR